MMQSEFEKRVNMQVSATEYAAIETVYMNSDLDKDEFCKMWKKMNAQRIKAAKAEQKMREENEALISALGEIINKDYSNEQYEAFARDILNKKEIAAINKAGISMETSIYNVCFNTYHEVPATLSAVVYNIKKSLGIVA